MNAKRISCLPSLENIQHARKNLNKVAYHTPFSKNLRLSMVYNSNIFLKREDLQSVRSYKIRGAYNKISQLTNEEKQGGIVCASAGNHAQGVAFSCRELKINGTIFMPVTTPGQKLEQVQIFGGESVHIRLIGDSFDSCKNAAMDFCQKHKSVFVHPFDDLQIIEGQATIALEILEDSDEELDYLFIPIGGGGLAAGIASVFSILSPHTKLIGVEPKGAASMKISLQNQYNTELEFIDKFVDGAAVQKVGDLNFEICRNLLSDCISVDEGKICDVILELYNKDAIVLEPAGALSIGALEQYADKIKGKSAACIISGGSNDITRMEEIKERALLCRGLKHYFMVKLPQRPGSLKEFVLNVLGVNDDITYFEYAKKNSKETALAIVGIELADRKDFDGLLNRMKNSGYFESYLNENEYLLNLII